MANNDDDYDPQLDLSSSTEGSENIVGEQTRMHLNAVVGLPPPDSDDEEAGEEQSQEENRRDESDFYSSDSYDTGSEPFDVDDYYKNVSDREPLPILTDDLIANRGVNDDPHHLNEIEPVNEDIVRITLASVLAASPQCLRDGFDPEELDKVLRDQMSYSLNNFAAALIGEELRKIPNASKTEIAFALAKAGWLRNVGSKFYAILPESEQPTVASLIEGYERNAHQTEKKRREADMYPNAEKEIRALQTFNLIVDLMHVVREYYRNNKIQYPHINTAYNEMVTGKKYPEIHKKYFNLLDLSPTKTWNNAWFNEYANRSTLKKFVQMARFSEIVVTDEQPPLFYFRADDEERGVRMFTDEDIREVREKWESGNAMNKNFGNNFGRRGQRAERCANSQQPKRRVQEDPNYRPSTFVGGLNGNDDDGSLQPSTSARNNTEPSTSAQRIRSQSSVPSEVNSSSRNGYQLQVNENRENPRETSPAREHCIVQNPFGGAPAQPKKDDSRVNRGNACEHGGGNQTNRRLEQYGDTSSDSDMTSEGSYSDEEPAQKESKRQKRADKVERKKEREMRRRERHKNEIPKPIGHSSFQNYKKPSSRMPVSREQEEVVPIERTENARSTSSSEQEPVQPISQNITDRDRQYSSDGSAPLVPRNSTARQVPLDVSTSTHNAERIVAQVPYRPAEGVMAKNKAEEEEKKKREQITEMRLRSVQQAQTQNGQPPVQHPFLTTSRPEPPQDNQRAYTEPAPLSGFGSVSRNLNHHVAPPGQYPQQPQASVPFDEEYRGRNHENNSRHYNYPQSQNPPIRQQHSPLSQQMQYPTSQEPYHHPHPMHHNNVPVHTPQFQEPYRREDSRASNRVPMQEDGMYRAPFEPASRGFPMEQSHHYQNGQHMDNNQMNHHHFRQPSYHNSQNDSYRMDSSNGNSRAPHQPHYSQYNRGVSSLEDSNYRGSGYDSRRHQTTVHHNRNPQQSRPFDPYGDLQAIGQRRQAAAPSGSSISVFGRANLASHSNDSFDKTQQCMEIMNIVHSYSYRNQQLTRNALCYEISQRYRSGNLIFPPYFDAIGFVREEMNKWIMIIEGPDPILQIRKP